MDNYNEQSSSCHPIMTSQPSSSDLADVRTHSVGDNYLPICTQHKSFMGIER